jgi:hypothetical protein
MPGEETMLPLTEYPFSRTTRLPPVLRAPKKIALPPTPAAILPESTTVPPPIK